MASYVGLLRGVNVGGHRKVPMGELRDALGELGWQNVRTLLASGNFVFEAKTAKCETLEKKLEADLKKSLGLVTDIMVRDAKEWDAIIAANPFTEQAESEPSRLLLVALKSKPAASAIEATYQKNRGPELIEVKKRDAYVFYPLGVGVSKLDLKPLGSGTGRNWNTVLKLKAMLA
jgi:uncharacterized protein (DUF1697 family)